MLASLRHPRNSQPQHVPSIAQQYRKGLALCFHPTSKSDLLGLGTSGVKTTTFGKSGVGIVGASDTDCIKYATSKPFFNATALTISAVVRWNEGGDLIILQSLSTLQIWCNVTVIGRVEFGVYGGSVPGTHKVQVYSTADYVVTPNQETSIVCRWVGGVAGIRVAINGVEVPTPNIGWADGIADVVSPVDGTLSSAKGPGVLYHLAAWTTKQDIVNLSANPWKIYEPTTRKILPVVSSDTRLTGSNVTQGNTSSSAGVTPTHSMSAGAATQGGTTSGGTVSSAHQLKGITQIQTQFADVGAIQIRHVLQGSVGTSTNQSTSGGVSSTLDLAGGSASQGNSSTSGQISITHVLSGGNAGQGSQTGFGSISTSHNLSGSNSQTNSAVAAGIVTQGQTLTASGVVQTPSLSSGSLNTEYRPQGENVSVPSATSSGAISTSSMLAGSGVAIDNIASASGIVQQHLLSGSASTQLNSCTSKRIYVHAMEYKVGEGRHIKYRGDSRLFVIM